MGKNIELYFKYIEEKFRTEKAAAAVSRRLMRLNRDADRSEEWAGIERKKEQYIKDETEKIGEIDFSLSYIWDLFHHGELKYGHTGSDRPEAIIRAFLPDGEIRKHSEGLKRILENCFPDLTIFTSAAHKRNVKQSASTVRSAVIAGKIEDNRGLKKPLELFCQELISEDSQRLKNAESDVVLLKGFYDRAGSFLDELGGVPTAEVEGCQLSVLEILLRKAVKSLNSAGKKPGSMNRPASEAAEILAEKTDILMSEPQTVLTYLILLAFAGRDLFEGYKLYELDVRRCSGDQNVSAPGGGECFESAGDPDAGNQLSAHEERSGKRTETGSEETGTETVQPAGSRLTEDYDDLAFRRYEHSRMVSYRNSSDFRFQGGLPAETEYRLPVLEEFDISECEIEIDDEPKKMYRLPPEIDSGSPVEEYRKNYEKILADYGKGTVFNNVNIRADDWYIDDSAKKFIIKTSRTEYYKSLVTNRAMDFEISPNRTVRDMYFSDPAVPALRDSVLSNHLGYNGFIITVDGYVPFIKRGENLSVENNMWGNSIQASLKTKYAVGPEGRFTYDGLLNGIRNEIKDELKIDPSLISEGPKLIYCYRDLVEGGKPQLLWYCRAAAGREEIDSRFREKLESRRERLLIDGERLLWIPVADLIDPEKVFIRSDGFYYLDRNYPMVPSAAASIILFVKYAGRKL